jgi:hypothetical protein
MQTQTIRIRVLQILEKFFNGLQVWAENMRQRCAVCADCGANRYTGAPCVQTKINSPAFRHPRKRFSKAKENG